MLYLSRAGKKHSAQKEIIIISDLRTLPIAAAFTLLSRGHNNRNKEVWISETKNKYGDYGDISLPKWRLRFNFLVCRLLGAKSIRSATSNVKLHDNQLTGVKSSLISITNDCLASKLKYPDLWNKLLILHEGAKGIVDALRKEDFSCVYLFNGRLASSYPIASYLYDINSDIYFYEYSGSNNLLGKSFSVRPFSPHNFSQRAIELLSLYKKSLAPLSDRALKGYSYAKNKLSNKFSRTTDVQPESIFEVVIFLSSPHEYTSLDKRVAGFHPVEIETMLRRSESLINNSSQKRIAVRAHPNMVNDPSCNQWIEELECLSRRYSFTLIRPQSKVSSHALISSASYVVTDISSIALDCYLMGYPEKSIVMGRPYFIEIIDYLQKTNLPLSRKIMELAYACSLLDKPSSFRLSIPFVLLAFLKII